MEDTAKPCEVRQSVQSPWQVCCSHRPPAPFHRPLRDNCVPGLHTPAKFCCNIYSWSVASILYYNYYSCFFCFCLAAFLFFYTINKISRSIVKLWQFNIWEKNIAVICLLMFFLFKNVISVTTFLFWLVFILFHLFITSSCQWINSDVHILGEVLIKLFLSALCWIGLRDWFMLLCWEWRPFRCRGSVRCRLLRLQYMSVIRMAFNTRSGSHNGHWLAKKLSA